MKATLTIFIFLGFSLGVSASDLFEDKQTLEVEIGGPLNSLIHHMEEELEYPFILKTEGLDYKIRMRARGHSRKKVCVFPPLRVEFGSNLPGQSLFFGQDDLKLVTHCHQSDKAQANTLKEYAAYQFFLLISEAAFRVRLLQINYVDTDGKRDTRRYGYLIESWGELAGRIGGEKARLSGISRKMLNDQQEALVYVFQYLIGNTDWSMVTSEGDDECCHNGKLVEKNQELLYVPYDFDLSGLVNANYAHPDDSLRIKRVTQRLYRGFCLDPEILSGAIQTIRSHQSDFRTIVDNLPALSEREKKKAHRFLERFFDEAENEEKILKEFEQRCLD